MTDLMTAENKGELFAALASAQGQFKPVETDKKVSFPTKGGSHVKYNYASFAAIIQMAQKPLSENGLSILQYTEDGNLVTMLAHASGQHILSFIPLPDSNDIKQLGANLSYLRRYQYTSLVGIVIKEEDNEAVVEGKLKSSPKPTVDQNTGEVLTPVQTAGCETEVEKKADPWPAKEGLLFELCQEVRSNTDYYESQWHLLNAIGPIKGSLKNDDNYQAYFSAATDHAKEKEAAANG